MLCDNAVVAVGLNLLFLFGLLGVDRQALSTAAFLAALGVSDQWHCSAIESRAIESCEPSRGPPWIL